MRIITLISALLFASVFTSLGLFGFWSYSAGQLESSIPRYFEENVPGKLRYERIVRHWDPMNMSMTLKGMTWSYFDADQGNSVVVNVGDVEMEANLFDTSKLSFKLPQDIALTFTHKESTQRYRLSTSAGVVDLGLSGKGSDIFSSANVAMLQKETQGHFEPVLQTGYIYLNKQLNPTQWSLSFNDIQFRNEFSEFDFPNRIDNIAMNWQLLDAPNKNFMDALVMVGANKTDFIKAFLEVWDGNTVLDVTDGRISYADSWYALKGRLSMDSQGYPDTEVFISTNKFQTVLDWVRTISGPLPLALDRMMRKLEKNQGSSQGLSIVSRGKNIYVNGSPAGETETVKALIERSF